jgi:DNA invertase Pin-like site-specific DNA recombinase
MTTAIAYMRCSGRSQIDGDTWERQTEAITRYAAANDCEVLEWYRDEGISGKTELENRPGLAACLERIENNGVKLMLVESADRLARDAMVAEIIVRQFQKTGGTIITAAGVNLTEGDDSSPTAALIRGVLALIAEFDRRVTVLKLKAARDRVKKKTGRCEGIRPFGTTPEESPILDYMKELRRRNFKYSEIAKYLNKYNHQSRSGKPWSTGTVAKILTRNTITQNCAADVQTES